MTFDLSAQEREVRRSLESRTAPATEGGVWKIVLQALGRVVASVTRRFEALEKRFEAHEAKYAALEAKAAEWKHCGTFEAGHEYRGGNFITDRGGLWICMKPTSSRPPGNGWRLAAKAGRDGRDAR